jgi:putative hemolysin
MPDWVVIVLMLILTAFLSGMEIAFLSANKLRIELESKQGNISAKIFSFFIKRPSRFIATALVGMNIAVVIYSIKMDQLLEPHLAHVTESISLAGTAEKVAILLSSTFISTIILLFTAEFFPKALFRINPNGVLNFFAIPYQLIFYILSPIVIITTAVSEFILSKVFGVKLSKENITFGKIDLDNYVRQVTDTSEEEEKEIDHEIKIFQNALGFSESRVRDAMIPRTEVVAVEVNSSLEVLLQKFIETRLSKILIYDGNVDKMIGYVYSYDLFKKPKSIRSIIWPVNFVPETLLLKDVLKIFITQHKSMAIVVDEFGGTSGLLTIEDVIEEIFGEIDDEHDEEELIEKKISDTEYIFAGRHEIDYLNDEYDLDLPVSEDYETLAGMLINTLQGIPEQGQMVKVDNMEFHVLAVNNARVDKIRLKILPEELE